MTKEAILKKHCAFKNKSGYTEYFTDQILGAMEEYANLKLYEYRQSQKKTTEPDFHEEPENTFFPK